MTAIAAGATSAATQPMSGRFLGLRPLLRKDATEWMRGRRAWIVAVVTTVFMVLTAANGAITTYVRNNFPEPGTENIPFPSLDPMLNLLSAPGSQIFLIAAIFAVASLIVHERETGTLAWVSSKPVSRGSIWLSKWVSSSIILAVAAAMIPFFITIAVVVVLYGSVAFAPLAVITVGMILAVMFYAAVGLAAGSVLPGVPAILAVSLGILFLVPTLAGLLPFDVSPYLPTSILDWTVGFAVGQDVGFITPIAWAIATVALIAFSIRQMERIEL
jgi:ABC-2 type transport system permease protein